MVGFIKGLFGPKKPRQEGFTPPPLAPKSAPQPDAFFLDADEAQSLGDLNYIRKAKAIRRTFPKTAGNPEELAITVEVSSLAKRNGNLNGQVVSSEAVPESLKKDEAAERRRTDTSMDMFRSMARSLKKP